MPTNAEIKALINTRVRAQRSHILNNGVAEILDFMVDNIAAGGGGTPGIDSVLAEAQALTLDRNIHLGGKKLSVFAGDRYFLEIDPDPLNEQVNVRALNGIDEEVNEAHLIVRTTPTEVTWRMQADFHDGTKRAQIEAEVNNLSANLNHQADAHRFNVGDVFIINFAGGGTTGLSIDNDGKIIRTP